MSQLSVGYFIGSLAKNSINRKLGKALVSSVDLTFIARQDRRALQDSGQGIILEFV
jgi:hypothetical protein